MAFVGSVVLFSESFFVNFGDCHDFEIYEMVMDYSWNIFVGTKWNSFYSPNPKRKMRHPVCQDAPKMWCMYTY